MPPYSGLTLVDASGATVKGMIAPNDQNGSGQRLTIKTASVEPGQAGEEFRIPLSPVDGGLAADRIKNPRGYSGTSGSGADTSWGNFWTLPPKTNALTLSSAVAMGSNAEVRMAVEFAGSLFILSGRYVHSVNTSHSVSTARDLGSGNVGTFLSVVDNNLFVCCGATDFIHKSTAAGSWSTSADVYAQVIIPTRRTIWRIRSTANTTDNGVSGIDANTSTLATAMFTAANWTNPGTSAGYVVGDQSYQVVWGVEYQGVPWYGRADGMFKQDTSGEFYNQTPQMKESPVAGNCIGAANLFGSLFIPTKNRGLLRISAGSAIAQGPEVTGTPNKSWWVRSMVEYNRAAFLLATNEQGTRQSILKLMPDDLGVTGQDYVFHELQDVSATNKSPWIQAFQATTNPEIFWGGGSATTSCTYFRLGNGGGRDIDDGCFPESVPVALESRPIAVMRRWYSGDLTEITTASGHHLTGTPNHPVMTDRGWVGLNELQVGDHVVHDGFPNQWELSGDPDVQRRNPTIREVFDFAAVRGPSERRSFVRENFHGDGQEGEVDVVFVDGELWNGIKARFYEPLVDDKFIVRNAEPLKVLTTSPSHSLNVGSGNTSAAGPSWSESLVPSLSAFSGSAHSLPLGHRSDGVPIPSQVVENRHVMDAVFSGDSFGGVATGVPLSDVVSIRRIPFEGHVYNLHTESNRFIASGIIVHNSYQYAATGELVTGNIYPAIGRAMKATLHGIDVYFNAQGSSPTLALKYNVDDFIGTEPSTTMYTNREAPVGATATSSGRYRFYANTSSATGNTFNFLFTLSQGGTPAGTTRSSVHEAYAFGILNPVVTDYIQVTVAAMDGDGVNQNGQRIGKRAPEIMRQMKAWQRDNSVLTMTLAGYEEGKTTRVVVVSVTEEPVAIQTGTNRPKKDTFVTLVLKRMDYAGAYAT